jgi:hypothetical protein
MELSMDDQTRSVCQVLAGAFAGAMAMYYLDPQQGRRRRALVRDKVVSVSNDTVDLARGQGRRVANKVHGVVAASQARFGRSDDEPLDEQRLHERVRACLGRVAEHPKAIQVEVAGTSVRLSGDVLASDARHVIKAVERVRGVERVDNGMTVHETGDGVPSLQGEPGRRNGGWRLPMWSVLALAAPVAVLAVTARPMPRRMSWMDRLPIPHHFGAARRFDAPRAFAERSARRVKDYLSELRTS